MRNLMEAERPASKPRLPGVNLEMRHVLARHALAPFRKRRRAPVEPVQRRVGANEIGCERFASGALERLTLRTPRERCVALDLFAQEEGRAKDCWIIARKIDAWRGDPASDQRA